MLDSVPSARSTTGSPLQPDAAPATAPTSGASRTADLAYSSFYAGALGGAAIAVFFLVLDALGGQPLFTPSLLGTALFTGADPTTVTEVRLDMVAYFSVVHFVAFFGLGTMASWGYAGAGARAGRLPALAAVLFVMLTGALLLGDRLLMPGVMSAMGTFRVLAANAVTAAAMTWFIGKASEA